MQFSTRKIADDQLAAPAAHPIEERRTGNGEGTDEVGSYEVVGANDVVADGKQVTVDHFHAMRGRPRPEVGIARSTIEGFQDARSVGNEPPVGRWVVFSGLNVVGRLGVKCSS